MEKIAGSDAFGYAFTSSRYPTGKKIQAAIEKDLVSFLNKAVKYSNEKEGQRDVYKRQSLICSGEYKIL